MYQEEQVRAGIALLDQKVPDWRDQVDVAELDMVEYRQCVLGQVYGSYHDGLDELDLDDAGAVAYGFQVPSFLSSTDEDEDFINLADTWKALLVKTATK